MLLAMNGNTKALFNNEVIHRQRHENVPNSLQQNRSLSEGNSNPISRFHKNHERLQETKTRSFIITSPCFKEYYGNLL